jgi:hypothetical protein
VPSPDPAVSTCGCTKDADCGSGKRCDLIARRCVTP